MRGKNSPSKSTWRSIYVVHPMAFLRSFGDVITGTTVTLFIRLQGGSDFLTSVSSGISALVYIISNLLFGLISRKSNRRTVILASSGFMVINQCIYLAFLRTTGWIPLETIFIIVIATRGCDGLFLGFFWPVLQSRIHDEKVYIWGGNNAADHERQIRFYNLGWNAGNVSGNVVLILATSIQASPEFLTVLYSILFLSTGALIINAYIAWRKFEDIRPKEFFLRHLREPSTKRAFRRTSKERTDKSDGRSLFREFRECWVAYLVVFTFGFTANVLFVTVTNHFTSILPSQIGFSLLAFIPVVVLIRSLFQVVGSGFIKIPENPESRFVPIGLGLTATLIILGLVVYMFPTVELVGLIVLLCMVVSVGTLLGILYSAGIAHVMNRATRVEIFQGLFESVNGMGQFTGALIAGLVTEFLPYFVPYWINAALALVLVIFSFLSFRT